MVWIDRTAITPGVLSMLRVNMGLRQGERVLVVTDVPTPEQWGQFGSDQVEVMLRRAYLARLVADLAREHLPAGKVEFLTFPSTGRSGVEPPDEAARAMTEADVVLAITSFSMSHTEAREEACRRGARVASMPRFLPEMFCPDGPMAVDYEGVAFSTRVLAGLINRSIKCCSQRVLCGILAYMKHLDTRRMSPGAQDAVRQRVVRAVCAGMFQAQAARVFGVSRRSVNAWHQRWRHGGFRAL
ncbi:MAG: helix-turn-helix domain-containing protein, partial [bacterium]|nr:helix-turn-helix domain-containing protein [bacterium]